MPSTWQQAEEINSASIDRFFAEPVEWRPMRKRGRDDRYAGPAGGSWVADDARPARGAQGDPVPFVAVIVWRPDTVDPGGSEAETSGAASSLVMLDFDIDTFRTDKGVIYPTIGDRFVVPNPDGRRYPVQMARPVTDDGTARVYVWCSAPE